jgi:hypothetical protein
MRPTEEAIRRAARVHGHRDWTVDKIESLPR